MKALISRFASEGTAATAIEYTMIAALMSVAVIAAFPSVATAISTAFNDIAARFPTN